MDSEWRSRTHPPNNESGVVVQVRFGVMAVEVQRGTAQYEVEIGEKAT